MFGQTAAAVSIDGFYNLKTDSLEQNNILKNSPTSADMANAEALKVLMVTWLKKIKSPNYYEVKARPIGKSLAIPSAAYTLYGSDTAKFVLTGVTSIATTNLPAGTTYKILPNGILQIVTPAISATSIVTVTATGPFTQPNGTTIATKNLKFELLKNNFPVPSPIYTNIGSETKSLDDGGILITTSSNVLNLEMKDADNATVQVFSTSGVLLLQDKFQTNELKINTSNLTRGTCLIKIVKP